MSGNFTERKMLWLEAVASDHDIQRVALAVAVRLATRYFNSQTGQAWPGVERLAKELHADRRSIQRAIASLIEKEWLSKREGGRGRGDSNHYSMNMGGAHAALNETQKGGMRDRKGGVHDRKRAACAPPEPVIEPGNEPVSVHTQKKTGSSSRPAGRRDQSTPSSSKRSQTCPEKWVFGPAEAKIALASPAKWEKVRAREEFEKFKDYYLAKGSRWADWSVVWERWCQNGANHPRRNKIADAVAGGRDFFERQEALQAHQHNEDY
ncbi:helix-turn-helix domain-containing protein [Bradyrhizobium sp. AZCC 1708]|uniref:helix-turn-helix domain-containing protein n=1 Tax=Bradyrhizobium sp. AZCC 1708 TaxID=3117015 RepID=UPI002FEF34DB